MSDYLESVANAHRERVGKQKVDAEYRLKLHEYTKQVDAAWQRLTGARVWTREGGGAIDRERWSTDGLAAVCALAKLLGQSNLAEQAEKVRDRIRAYLAADPARFLYVGVVQADRETLELVGAAADLLCRALAGQAAEALQEIEGVEICQHPDQWDALRLEINCCDSGLPIAPREVPAENDVSHAAANSKPESPTVDGATNDDALPKAKRGEMPSRIKAGSAYRYAMERIPDANVMTAVELFDAIHDEGEAAQMLPPNADAFRRYLNDCGIRLKKSGPKALGGSVVRSSDR